MIYETHNQSASTYEIRVQDHLDSHWVNFFDGWSISNLENGEVLLTNPNVDQAGLHGVLNRIRDLNLTLLSVTKTEKRLNGEKECLAKGSPSNIAQSEEP